MLYVYRIKGKRPEMVGVLKGFHGTMIEALDFARQKWAPFNKGLIVSEEAKLKPFNKPKPHEQKPWEALGQIVRDGRVLPAPALE